MGGGGSNEQGCSYFLDLATGSSESVLERPDKFQPVFTMVNVVSFFALKSSEWNKLLLTSNGTWLEPQSLKILKTILITYPGNSKNVLDRRILQAPETLRGTCHEHNRNSSCNIHKRSCNNFMKTFSPKQNCFRKQTSIIAYTRYQLLYGQEAMSPSSMRGKCNLVVDLQKLGTDITTFGHIFSKSRVNGFEKPSNILHHSCEGYFAYWCSLLGREGDNKNLRKIQKIVLLAIYQLKAQYGLYL